MIVLQKAGTPAQQGKLDLDFKGFDFNTEKAPLCSITIKWYCVINHFLVIQLGNE